MKNNVVRCISAIIVLLGIRNGKLKQLFCLGVLLLFGSSLNAQVFPVTHTAGTMTSTGSGTSVTVTSTGSAGSTPHCGVSPFWIGNSGGSTPLPGSYTFTFVPVVKSVQLKFTAMNNVTPDTETITININGPVYPLTPGNFTVFSGSCAQPSAIIAGGKLIAVPGVGSIGSGGQIDIVQCNIGSIMISTNGLLNGTVFSFTFDTGSSITPVTGPTNVCTGNSITLANATPGGTWSSGNPAVAAIGSTTGIVSGISAGTAIITYTISGCTATAVVTVNPSPAPITGPLHLCVGDITTYADAVPGGTWSSSNSSIITIGSSSGTAAGIATGIATITYTNICGFVTKMVTVATPSVIPGPIGICQNATMVLTNSVPGGMWSSNNTLIAIIGSSSGILTGVSVGTTTITYSLGGSCYVTAPVTINPLPDAGVINGPAGLCLGDDIVLTATVPGGSWSVNNAVATVSFGVVTGVSAGTAVVSYSVTNSCGTTVATKTVIVTTMPVITGRQKLCVSDTVMLDADVPGGTWQSSSITIATISNGTVTGVSAGAAIISYYIDTGCAATIPVTVNALPNAGTITGSTKLCPGGVTTLLNAVTGGNWHSSDTSVIIIDPVTGVITARGTGTATITYITLPNANGCTNKATFIITVSPAALSINEIITPITCYGQKNGRISVTVGGGTGPYEYEWSTGETASSIDSLGPGVYSLGVLEPGTHCIATDSFVIAEPDSLQLNSRVTNDVCQTKKGSIEVAVSGGTTPYSYAWSNNAAGNQLSGLVAGGYSVTVTDKNGCLKSMQLEIVDSCTGIMVHNAVSPNGDGINDTWVVEGLDQYPANTVHIFDKWGDLLFEQNNYQNDWYGKGKSGILPDGTYYYLVKLNAQNANSGKDVFTGSLLIKR